MPSMTPHEGGGAFAGGTNGMVPPGIAASGSLFGDGTYSGNIIQGGAALQPQNYLLDGITPLADCIVVTGAATVAPDATTGAAVWMAHNVVLIGASASLSAATNCKGLLGFVNGLVALRGGAHLHMDKLGKAGNFGNLTVLDLVPASIKRKLKNDLAAYVVLGEGASGGLGVPTYAGYLSGNPGYAAGAMQSGGGGSGQSGTYSGYGTGKGGKGGPCCGGAGSGGNINNYANAPDAGDYGGPGGAGLGGLPNNTFYASGGAGDPVGITNCGNPGEGAGGGLLMLFTPALSIASGCVVSSDGAKGGGTGNGCSGGSAGGGCICIVTAPGGLSNAGTIRASGGAGVVGATGLSSGPGGVGSVNTFPIAT